MQKNTCDHCLLTFPERDAIREDVDGCQHVFCCHGCRGVFFLIRSEGLADFYDKRHWDAPGSPANPLKELDLKAFGEDVRSTGQGSEIDIFIDGIRCASCVWLNEKFLLRAEGVTSARLNFATHRAKILWNPDVIGLEKILRRVQAIGYTPRPYRESEQYAARKAESRDLLVRFGTAAFLSSQLMIYSIALYAGYFQGIDSGTKIIFEIIAMMLTIPVIAYSGMPFIRSTLSGLRHLHFTMDSLISIGAGSAFMYSVYQIFIGGTVYFDTAAMIITLILLGRYIESTAKGKASETIERLSELAPREARILQKSEGSTKDLSTEETVMVPLAALKKDDRVKVIPGERIPADGRVVYGESETDESILTGESRPLRKTPGSPVIGGSMNLFGTLIFEVTHTGKETVLAGIIRAVEDAQAGKPRLQILADRIVGYFVPAILITSLVTVAVYFFRGASMNDALMTGVSVLVIACPCSLGLATPLAVLVFTTMASSRGILIRGGEVIENTSRLDQVVFDKTGTITEGRPSLKAVLTLDSSLDSQYILRMAASMENLSEHSIGRAIVSAWNGDFFPVRNFQTMPGRGIQGSVDNKDIVMGNEAFMKDHAMIAPSFSTPIENLALPYEKAGDTVIYMGWGGILRVIFIVSDCLREESVDTVKEILLRGKRVAVVSGDNRTTTAAVASAAGIEHVVSEMSPGDKRDYIRELQQRGARLLMVGDGINDAPALTEAFVGIAMGKGTDIAMESADAVLVRSDLSVIPYFLDLSLRAYRVIRQNIFWAFFYNIVAIPLAITGVLHPIIAAGAMAASSLFVVLNSLRIRKGAAA
ncbi:MAG: heavy metal translocating P-type ATPase [Nitrospirae bacterium]|nr:heavy metal translocating P-type ATPase [Nitrospirota bacterium]